MSNEELFKKIHLAVCDPYAYVPREREKRDGETIHESVTHWSSRAVMAVLAEHEKQVRESVLKEADTAAVTLQMKDADRLCDGGGHSSGCAYGDTDTCHGEEAHATHERVLAALRKLRGTR